MINPDHDQPDFNPEKMNEYLHNYLLDSNDRHIIQCTRIVASLFFSAGFVPNVMTAKCKPRKKTQRWIPNLQEESVYCKEETSQPPVTKCGTLGLCLEYTDFQ